MIEYIHYSEPKTTRESLEILYDDLIVIQRKTQKEGAYPSDEEMQEIFARLTLLLTELGGQKADLATMIQVQMIFNKIKEIDEDAHLVNSLGNMGQ